MTEADKRTANRLKNKVLIERIKDGMVAHDFNKKTLSEHITGKPGSTLIHDILVGKSGRPMMDTIKNIAAALGTTPDYLVGDTDDDKIPRGEQIRPIQVIGFAEAGAFRAMNDFHNLEHLDSESVLAQPYKRFPHLRHFALKIRGDSMNAARPHPLLEGMTALFVDFIDGGLEIENGRIYAVRRTQDGGQTWECTVKRAHVFRDRYELSPESTNPNHRSVVLPRPPVEDGGTEVEVIGLLYAVQFSYD